MSEYKRIYAVDFDGTLAETKFPEIVKPYFTMFMTCKEIKRRGGILILWTCRCGKDLDDAVEFCRKHGLEFDYINENVPENVEKFGNDSRKIFAHEYIDDKSWSPVREKVWAERIMRARWRSCGHLWAIICLLITAIVIQCFALHINF